MLIFLYLCTATTLKQNKLQIKPQVKFVSSWPREVFLKARKLILARYLNRTKNSNSGDNWLQWIKFKLVIQIQCMTSRELKLILTNYCIQNCNSSDIEFERTTSISKLLEPENSTRGQKMSDFTLHPSIFPIKFRASEFETSQKNVSQALLHEIINV